MAMPTDIDFRLLKRCGRYLSGRKRLIQSFVAQEEPKELTFFSDSDHAGCTQTTRGESPGSSSVDATWRFGAARRNAYQHRRGDDPAGGRQDRQQGCTSHRLYSTCTREQPRGDAPEVQYGVERGRSCNEVVGQDEDRRVAEIDASCLQRSSRSEDCTRYSCWG